MLYTRVAGPTTGRTPGPAPGVLSDAVGLAGGVCVDLKARALLFRQGDAARYVFALTEGVVKLVRNEEARELIVSLRGAGSLLGLVGAVLDEKYLFTAQAVTPCRLLRVPASDLLHLMKSDVHALWRIFAQQMSQMRNDIDHATAQGCLPLRTRLARVLLMLLDAQASRHELMPVRLALPMRHWELAQFLAVTPEHLSRVLKEMADDGEVRRDKGWLVVDPRRLRAAACGESAPTASVVWSDSAETARAAQRWVVQHA